MGVFCETVVFGDTNGQTGPGNSFTLALNPGIRTETGVKGASPIAPLLFVNRAFSKRFCGRKTRSGVHRL